jgi:Na+-driven multidrug efflux pump
VLLLPGPTAFVAALLMQAATSVLLSHLCAERGYSIGFDRGIQRRIWQAGWPLAVNALLLYAVFQGEKLFVGGVLGLEVLGTYAIAAQLALLPVMIAGRLSIGSAFPCWRAQALGTLRGTRPRQDVVQLFLAAACSSGSASCACTGGHQAALRRRAYAQSGCRHLVDCRRGRTPPAEDRACHRAARRRPLA